MRSKWFLGAALGAGLLLAHSQTCGAAALGTGFTYQGQLKQSGSPVNGTVNLDFSLWNDPTATNPGNQVGSLQSIAAVSVSSGLFTVQLNGGGEFGASAFTGEQRWLQISVNGTPLSPRQELTAAPNALFALNTATATTASNATNATQLNGHPASFYQNATNIGSGTLADARLSGNIPRLNAANTFGKFTNTFAGNVGIGNSSPLSLLQVGDAYTPTVASIARFNGDVSANGTLVSDQGTLLSRSAAGLGVASIVLDAEADAGGTSWFINSNSNTSPFGSPGGSLTFESGIAAMTITAAGNVGIGTQFPQRPLHVVGETRIDGVLMVINQPAYASAGIDVNGLDGGAFVVGSDSTGLKMDSNTIQARSVTAFEGTPYPATLELNPAGGVVEIGNPPFLLEGTLTVGEGGIGTTSLSVGDSDDLGTLEVNGNTLRVTAGAAGKVGIGESLPEAKLDVKEANNRVALFNRTGSDGTLVNWQRDSANVGSVSVAAGVVSYNAFTGSHYGWLPEGQTIERYALVRMTGENRRWHGDAESEIIYGIEPTSRANDPACLGAYLALSESTQPHSLGNPHLIMAAGNGEMWVVDTGGTIRPGDYLISSAVRGCAMRDDPSTYPVGYIVARAAERLDWAGIEPTKGRKLARISVFFESFVRQGGVDELAKTVKSQQEQIDILRNENARMTMQLQAMLGEVRQIKARMQADDERTPSQACRQVARDQTLIPLKADHFGVPHEQ